VRQAVLSIKQSTPWIPSRTRFHCRTHNAVFVKLCGIPSDNHGNCRSCRRQTVLLFFGAAGGFIYKAVNTMDSMIGYKNDKYLYFGRFAAKLDDVLNFIPSRIGGVLMVLSAGIASLAEKNGEKHYSMKNAWKIFTARQKKAQQSEFRPDGSCVRRCINGRFIRR